MKRKYLLLAFLFISLDSFSQEKLRSIKIFSGYEYHISDEINDGNGEFNSDASFALLKSISYAFGKKNAFHEIELNKIASTYSQFKRVRNNNIVNGNEIFMTRIRVRYSYNAMVLASNKFNLTAGLSTSPYYIKERNDPLVLSSYNRVTKHYGFYLGLISRIQYVINESFFVELNFPLSILNWYFERLRIDNPAIPKEQQITDEYYSDFFPSIIQASLGIGYKF